MTRLRSPRRIAVLASAVLAGAAAFFSSAPDARAQAPAAPAAAGEAVNAAQAHVDKVNLAIKNGVKFLYSIQKPNGSWESAAAPGGGNADPDGKQWGGATSMAVYALLAAGENPQEPRLAKAIDWLLTKSDPMVGYYAAGIRPQVWTFLPDNHPQRSLIKKAIDRDFKLLMEGYHKDPKKADMFGFFPYFKTQKDWFDRSVSQYGVLGMWAVAQEGAEVPTAYWEMTDKVWKKAQNPEGGWNYKGEGFSTPNMTAAGLATLFICQDYLLDPKSPCTGNKFDQNIELAMAWMDKNAAAMLGGSGYYGMYGVERIGVASGRKYFGKTAWYDVGSANIVKKQNPDGSWRGEHEYNGIPNTCFCIYFLTRGRAPVIMNKLEWKSVAKEGLEAGWNQRHRDLANFSKWMAKNLDGRFLNWQIVNLKGNVDDLHDSPILYLAGSEALAFSPEDTAKLKKFVEDGGMIFGNADCAKQPFVKSFRALGKAIYPNDEFRQLPPNHPIYASDNVQFKAAKWKIKPAVLGLSNGVRELMILVPDADPAKAWQSRSDRTREEMFELGANISLYANGGQNQRYRGVTHILKDAGKNPTNKIRIARLQYKGNYDPEPGGWRRQATFMKNSNLAVLTDYDKPVELGKDQLAGYKFASLTGTVKFTLTQAERDELKKWVEGGGTLLVDAAGGSADFGDSAETELLTIFGDAAKKGLAAPLPGDHPLFGAPKIDKFEYRSYARKVVGRTKAPRIKAFAVNNRLGVYFSREDLSAGLVGQEIDGIIGYDPETASAIVRNILTYDGAVGGAPVAGAPADAPAEVTPAAAPAEGDKPATPAAPTTPAASATDK